jgi:hypothetical protein
MSKDIHHSIYESAPELLLDKIAQVNDILNKLKAKSGETENWKFWTSVSETMQFAIKFFNEIRFINERNHILEIENAFLREHSTNINRLLMEYETIRKLICNGKLEEMTKVVNEKIIQESQNIHPQDKNSEDV